MLVAVIFTTYLEITYLACRAVWNSINAIFRVKIGHFLVVVFFVIKTSPGSLVIVITELKYSAGFDSLTWKGFKIFSVF